MTRPTDKRVQEKLRCAAIVRENTTGQNFLVFSDPQAFTAVASYLNDNGFTTDVQDEKAKRYFSGNKLFALKIVPGQDIPIPDKILDVENLAENGGLLELLKTTLDTVGMVEGIKERVVRNLL
jgi:hypothetical protein